MQTISKYNFETSKINTKDHLCTFLSLSSLEKGILFSKILRLFYWTKAVETEVQVETGM